MILLTCQEAETLFAILHYGPCPSFMFLLEAFRLPNPQSWGGSLSYILLQQGTSLINLPEISAAQPLRASREKLHHFTPLQVKPSPPHFGLLSLDMWRIYYCIYTCKPTLLVLSVPSLSSCFDPHVYLLRHESGA